MIPKELYYIHYEHGFLGPLDFLGVIRKVRNGTLEKNHMLRREEEENPRPAYQHSELYDVLMEQERVQFDQSNAQSDDDDIAFIPLLKSGFAMVKEDQTGMMVAGLFLLSSILGAGALSFALPDILSAIIAPTFAVFCFMVCMATMLRISRVQLLSLSFFRDIFRRHGVALLGISAPIGLLVGTLPWALSQFIGQGAWVFSLFLSVVILSYSVFLCLFITDRELPLKLAFKHNHQAMASLGMSTYALILGMFVMVVLSLPMIVIPLLALPVVLQSLCIVYDQSFAFYEKS